MLTTNHCIERCAATVFPRSRFCFSHVILIVEHTYLNTLTTIACQAAADLEEYSHLKPPFIAGEKLFVSIVRSPDTWRSSVSWLFFSLWHPVHSSVGREPLRTGLNFFSNGFWITLRSTTVFENKTCVITVFYCSIKRLVSHHCMSWLSAVIIKHTEPVRPFLARIRVLQQKQRVRTVI